jgi:CubicO group peptidase (beta-lactamase class C family)
MEVTMHTCVVRLTLVLLATTLASLVGCAAQPPPAQPGLPQTTAQAAVVPTTLPTSLPPTTVALTAAPIVVARSDADIAAGMSAYLDKLFTAKLFNGDVLVARNGKIIFHHAYGMANRDTATPITDRTRFYLASLTKQFTAAAIMLLEQDGKLYVQDRICMYLPECPDTWKPITIHQLLTHTAGLPHDSGLSDTKPVTPAELQAAIARLPLQSTPGTRNSYSNAGYMLAGRIVEQVSGEPYGMFLQKRIFGPLGMADTGYPDGGPQLAQGYETATIKASTFEPTSDYAAAGVYSTAADLLRWDQALYTDTPLTADSRARMFTQQTSTDLAPDIFYGYGWALQNVRGHLMIAHAGGAPGWASSLVRFVDDHITVIVLANQETFDALLMQQAIGDIIFGTT